MRNRMPAWPRSLGIVLTGVVWSLPAISRAEPGADAPAPAPRIQAVLLAADHVTPERLKPWKQSGVTAVVVPVDESMEPSRWARLAHDVAGLELSLYAWVEVARSPALADAHPDWMAATGGHHHDWRRRFPDAPKPRAGEVIKAWPWVPIGYAPAFEAHRERLRRRLAGLPGRWSGVFLNDLQAGPSSCGCGNDQCRWALDYGAPSTAAKEPGDDAAARLVADLQQAIPGKTVIPVWVTECEEIDLPGAPGGTGFCGQVSCAKTACWERYAKAWNPLVTAAQGPLALAAWSSAFQRDPDRWPDTARALFQHPPRGGTALSDQRAVVVLEGWSRSQEQQKALVDHARSAGVGWVLALDPIDQSWQPRAIAVKNANKPER